MLRLMSLAVLLGVAFAAPRLDGRIVGGYQGDILDFPYQISMQVYGQHICGGSIIGSKYIVTAAHCTDGMVASLLNIRAGSNFHATGGQNIKVARIIQHPNYDSVSQDYDISILVLAENLVFDDTVKSIALPSENAAVPSGKNAVCSGWGYLKENGSTPASLMFVFLETISRETCQQLYNRYAVVTDRMICTFNRGQDACQGDSGGPLALDDTLVGVVSWGIGCARPNFPGVYADVGYLRDFIAKNTGI